MAVPSCKVPVRWPLDNMRQNPEMFTEPPLLTTPQNAGADIVPPEMFTVPFWTHTLALQQPLVPAEIVPPETLTVPPYTVMPSVIPEIVPPEMAIVPAPTNTPE